MAHLGAYSSYAARLAGLALTAMLAGVPAPADAATAAVSIQGFAFRPAATTVTAGDAVTWKDLDGAQHTATADSGAWTTGVLNSGQTSAAISFTLPGVFTYHCAIHASMTGSVTVVAIATPRPTAPPPAPVPAPARTAPPTPPQTAARTVGPPAEPQATIAPTAAPPTQAETTTAPQIVTPAASGASLALASPSVTPAPEASAVAAVPVAPAAPPTSVPGALLVAGGAIAALALAAGAVLLARRRG